MDFRVSRDARDEYRFDEKLFSVRGDAVFADPLAARRFAQRMVAAGGSRPDRPVQAGDIDAMGLIHEIQHLAIANSAARLGDRPFAEILESLATRLEAGRLDATLGLFEDTFPAGPVYGGALTPDEYLDGTTDGSPNREVSLEELLLLWVANQNPAFMGYQELFDDRPLETASDYEEVVEGLRLAFARRAEATPGGEDLVERLLTPARLAPGSLVGQVRWMRDNWPDVVGPDLLARLTLTLDVLQEEEEAARRRWFRGVGDGGGAGHGGGAAATFGGFAGTADEPERFSRDRDWMPEVVLMAKSTYVWLDQLSRRYGQPIWTLDGIPDEELSRLREAGITGLWLIGLWERSHASQRIKQLRGNSEAVASAYSLMDYRIADDIGGEAAFMNLRDRAWAHGIRLASDMVPNHMGIDSRWVVEHPDWFVQRPNPPFPAYSFNGPNLSRDERVGIYIDDHYYDDSDAAVVFRRVDRWSGQERFIYHGNDGTSFPWNDTAQLDYLKDNVREAVIQTILAVARRFPIIRFDAAMTLAKRHVQRLWYPLPGQGGAIPSRAESAMSQDEFDALLPNEFWREVVDRVATEAPDTLLLAEAFWMMEGYFVRTLGMHRVYNSAFMHMLRDERNAEYHTVIRETLAFDPEILKRYVNFMNNPDERTAIDQFGDGDKYFGVATLLATLPGLPMIGHGQIEGFREKYGMEFRRATLDEMPNEGLMARHEGEIFPLLRQRWRFADARDFRLYDFETGDGSPDENVFAYSNGTWDSRSLIVYNNRYAETRGWVRGCADALGIGDDGAGWLILRDARSGLEYLRNGHDLHARGLEMELRGYQCHAFLSFEAIADGPDREWARLAWRLGLKGVPNAHGALREQRLEPVADAVTAFMAAGDVRRVAGAALARDPAAGDAAVRAGAEAERATLGEVAAAAGAEAEAGAVADELEERLLTIVRSVRAGRTPGAADPDARALAEWLGPRRERWSVLHGWVQGAALVRLAGAAAGGRAGLGSFDGWGVDRALGSAMQGIGLEQPVTWRSVELVRALLAVTPGALRKAAGIESGAPETWFDEPAVRAAAGWNSHAGVAWVNREAYLELLDALAARDSVADSSGSFAARDELATAIETSGYRVTPDPTAMRDDGEPSAEREPATEAVPEAVPDALEREEPARQS
jgi:glycosidase